MKYLIVKGWLGFGDRLESLKMAVAFAIRYNLQIYVDWRDAGWSHGENDFYTYFKLVNMPVLNSLADIPEDATYFPAYWKGHLDEHLSYEFIVKTANEGLRLDYLDKEYPGDVIVYACNGNRILYPDSRFFANVFRVVDPRILQRIRAHARAYPLASSWGIHIRGTDRVREKDRLRSIQSLVTRITSFGGLNKAHMVVVSDDYENAEIWKRFYSQSYLVSTPPNGSHKGNHNLSKDQLPISKDQLNVDMLVDFFVLCYCELVYGTSKDSRFAQESRRLHPFIDQIL